MRLAQALSLAVLAGLVLSACARPAAIREATPAPAPPGDAALTAPPASTPGTAPAPAAAPVPDGGVVVLTGPGGSQWVKPGVDEARYRADVDGCVGYAQAQIAHDERIERDSAAAFDTFPSGLGTTELRSGMRRFERGNRRGSLFNECMIAKGYTKP